MLNKQKSILKYFEGIGKSLKMLTNPSKLILFREYLQTVSLIHRNVIRALSDI